jgi:hypothetical protein
MFNIDPALSRSNVIGQCVCEPPQLLKIEMAIHRFVSPGYPMVSCCGRDFSSIGYLPRHLLEQTAKKVNLHTGNDE